MALRAVRRNVDVVHHVQAVVARRVAERAVVLVRRRQRNVIRGQIRRALEARGIEVAGAALAARDVCRAVRLLRRAHHGRRRADETLPRLMAGRADDRGDEAVHHRGRRRAGLVGEHEGIEGRRRVAALAGNRARRDVIRRQRLHRRRADEAESRAMAERAVRREARVIHRRHGVRDHEGREVGRRVTVRARRGADRNVIGRFDHGRGCAGERQSPRVAGVAGQR